MNLSSHIKECFGFVPVKELWRALCSLEVNVAVAVILAVYIVYAIYIDIDKLYGVG